jgi:hypothetical protein
VLETGKIQLELSWLEQPRLCSVWEHRTIRWCTGQCPVRQANSSEVAVLGNSPATYGYNSPDCPVCTGLSGEPTVGRANGRPRSARDTWPSQRLEGGTGLSGVHRTCPVRQRLSGGQRSAAPVKERNRAPDCPVRHATEGKKCLPRLLSTAPSCLGAIKGTPRRMEEHTKHLLSIPKHQDINSAPLILCDSD